MKLFEIVQKLFNYTYLSFYLHILVITELYVLALFNKLNCDIFIQSVDKYKPTKSYGQLSVGDNYKTSIKSLLSKRNT